jgi:hypothetical protein
LPDVLASGRTDVTLLFVSMSAREPDGRDAEYLEWHSLDHRVEQYRVAGIRHSLRLVSTPACRAQRAASGARYDAVDHVMAYFFADAGSMAPFSALSDALTAERRPLALPSVEFGLYDLIGKVAAPRVVVGADVIPWRPALGVYVVVEEGLAPPGDVTDVDGVAGAWWGEGTTAQTPFPIDRKGLQLTLLFLDEEPVGVAGRLRAPLERRWAGRGPVPLLAAPFHVVVPFDWDRHLP